MAHPAEKIANLEAKLEAAEERRRSTTNVDLEIALTKEITTIREQILQLGTPSHSFFPSARTFFLFYPS